MEEKKDLRLEIDLLWQKFLDGDGASFDRLYHKCVRLLFAYGLQFSSDRELVKDCIQDIFIKILEIREQKSHINNFLDYLCTGLKNRIINSLKRDKIHQNYINSLEFSDIDFFTPEQQLEYLEDEHRNSVLVERILKLLTPQQRKVVQYRYIDNLSLEEISMLLKINYQSTQNILQRAIVKIKKHFLK